MKEVKCPWSHGSVHVCVHERAAETGKSSCGHQAGVELRNWLKTQRNIEGLKGLMHVSVSSCLGVCPKNGTAVAVTPVENAPTVTVVEPVKDREVLWMETKRLLGAEQQL